jgi:opacity protein-like surface antigen
MKKICRITVLYVVTLAASLLTSTFARAQDAETQSRWPVYVSLFGGGSGLTSNVHTTHAYFLPDEVEHSLETGQGYLLGGTIGVRAGDIIRLEVELSHAEWDAKSYVFGGGLFQLADLAEGSVNMTYMLANAWADWNNDSAFTPYIGGGVGLGWAIGTNVEYIPIGPYEKYSGDGAIGFAFQLGAGMKFDMTEHASIDLGYRFKGVPNIDFKSHSGSAPPHTEPYKGADLYSHNVQLGLTWQF